MKKFLLIFVVAFLVMVGCSSEDSAAPKEESKPKEEKQTEEVEKDDEPTQEELDQKLKEEAVEADFVELNVDNPPDGKKVKATGEVTLVHESGVGGTFSLTTDEGIYSIQNMSLEEVEEGQEVTAYGTTSSEKAEDGSPQIVATIIEVVDGEEVTAVAEEEKKEEIDT
ncbi:vacuolar-type H+-ATPase subunit I/STV1 [Bacillus thermophilus]|uniref:Vacuolar-type H+-ATPase subunit I/STV1 n=1 Tax=Siminovitchia thermophila TaxID=1245522 RepID=A0ABS2RDM1_9BACI|nr:hypothetical protein [Siminovitchia thermophila]MBM7717294.1 vacuolar-type H+-ATPase subunit I/STV1 [Siminovitchia thermophila]ONK24294.1 hypothetical protein BLX87_06100 [Bacillus sp. VT-16-64]